MHKMQLASQQHTHPRGMQIHIKTENQKTQHHLLVPIPTASNLQRRKMANCWNRYWQQPNRGLQNHKPDIHDTESTHLPQILLLEEEGLQDDKHYNQNYPQTIPEYILPTQHIPIHQRPDLVRAIEYTSNPEGQLIPDQTYRGRRQLQIVKCKYSMDGNTQAVIDHIYNIYKPLKQALQIHGTLIVDIKIIPIVISRTIIFKVKTLV